MNKLIRSSAKWINETLVSIGSRPKKCLSQNFLIDGNVIRKIIAESNISAGESILEIGPGLGGLTEALLLSGADVHVVEKDASFESVLNDLENLHLNICDIKDFKMPSEWKKGKLIANLPYHITSPILTRFVVERDHFTDIIVMVQDEFADRMVAKPGTKDFGSLSVFLQFYSEITYAFKVTSSCFYPKPSVDSAIIHLKLKDEYPLENEFIEGFFALTRTAFQQRRKQLINSLSTLYDKEVLAETLQKLGFDVMIRPERLSLNDFVLLFKTLTGI